MAAKVLAWHHSGVVRVGHHAGRIAVARAAGDRRLGQCARRSAGMVLGSRLPSHETDEIHQRLPLK